jgi:hypothetical protein
MARRRARRRRSGVGEVIVSTVGALGFLMCPTGKREYADEGAALKALRTIRFLAHPDRVKGTTESSAYPCGLCERWHLTSTQQTRRRTGARHSRSRR